jgi:hypothetical protein
LMGWRGSSQSTVKCEEMRWDWMRWDEMRWDWMRWDGMRCEWNGMVVGRIDWHFQYCRISTNIVEYCAIEANVDSDLWSGKSEMKKEKVPILAIIRQTPNELIIISFISFRFQIFVERHPSSLQVFLFIPNTIFRTIFHTIFYARFYARFHTIFPIFHSRIGGRDTTILTFASFLHISTSPYLHIHLDI